MKLNPSDREIHALYCPVKNTKTAMFLVACFAIFSIVNWRNLHKVTEHPDLIEILFALIVVVMLAKWMVNFTCFRERLVFGLVIVSMVVGEAEKIAPSAFNQHFETLRYGYLALSVLGLIVSLSMLIHSVEPPDTAHNLSTRA